MSTGSVRVDPATATMISLIGSLADNKGALGRRYGEWAVSAPTIESAVAAAAMAQDELGHARSTYPVLAKLGVGEFGSGPSAAGHGIEPDSPKGIRPLQSPESGGVEPDSPGPEESGLDTGHPMFVISQELPDWASFIAANLVVDGVLTTFVAGTRDSSIEPLAQRARKILQEEGAHRVHAEAWARRIVAAGGDDLRLLVQRIEEMWAQAARWPGPDSDPGYQDAIAQGMVRDGPLAIRDRVRDWLTALMEGFGVSVSLPEPGDWSDWDPLHRR
ncbi:MAG TPA: Phenylacetic acid catabolic protein [Solirubrobacteraceae bacterium]|nr:Phenylacetic acid catabolic protein [Solirubrobacteraceae bacterium]